MKKYLLPGIIIGFILLFGLGGLLFITKLKQNKWEKYSGKVGEYEVSFNYPKEWKTDESSSELFSSVIVYRTLNNGRIGYFGIYNSNNPNFQPVEMVKSDSNDIPNVVIGNKTYDTEKFVWGNPGEEKNYYFVNIDQNLRLMIETDHILIANCDKTNPNACSVGENYSISEEEKNNVLKSINSIKWKKI